MTVQSLTYTELSTIWGVSKDAARKKVEGLRLPRKLGNDGKARVTIDLEEIQHSPKPPKPERSRPPQGDRPDSPAGDQKETMRPPSLEISILQSMVETLRADLERERTSLKQEQQEHRSERERADRLSAELIGMSKALVEAKAEATKYYAESKRADVASADRDAWRSMAQRSWWKRLVG